MKIFSVAASFCAIALPFASAGEAMTKKSFSALVEKAGVAAMKKVTDRRKLDQMSLDRGHVFRQLEDFPPECNSTYNALWEDESLNAAYDAYDADLSATLADASSNTDQCTDNGSGDISCDLSATVPSETTFRDACTAAGGDVAEVPLDISCSLNMEGEAGSIFLDLPPGLDCFPSGDDFAPCETYLYDAFDSLLAFLEGALEEAYTQSGFTDVSCNVGDAGPNGGGGSSASMQGYGLVASAAMFGAALLV